MTVNGTPASGDSFSVAPAGKASVFSTLSNLIGTLSSGTLTTAQLATQIGGALQQIDGAINQFSTVSASVGARLNSVTASQSTGQAEQTDLKGSISQISDTDYAAAITRLSSEQITLQAAQESYASIAKLVSSTTCRDSHFAARRGASREVPSIFSGSRPPGSSCHRDTDTGVEREAVNEAATTARRTGVRRLNETSGVIRQCH